MLCRQHHDGMPRGLAPHRYSKEWVDKKRDEALRQVALRADASEKRCDELKVELARVREFLDAIQKATGKREGPFKADADGVESERK